MEKKKTTKKKTTTKKEKTLGQSLSKVKQIEIIGNNSWDIEVSISEDEQTLFLKPMRPTFYKVINIGGAIVIATLLFVRYVL